MKTALLAILVTTTLAQGSVVQNFLSDKRIQEINQHATTWKAGRNFPEDTPLSHIKSLLGTRKSDKAVLEFKEEDTTIADEDIPERFDAREYWLNCTGIRQIADQSACGDCWAVATATTISDKICIHSNGANKTPVSALDLISCCTDCGGGCKGGFPLVAWKYWVSHGLVTGGSYKSGVGCKPYPFPPCSHDQPSDEYQPCSKDQYPTPSCAKKCSTDSIDYEKDRIYGAKVYNLGWKLEEVQKEIMKNGPVASSFNVYDDFLSYKSGVYQRGPNWRYVGGHSVRVIGWGTENGVPYWLAANSWNEKWGDNGTFKILRGQNHCDIEREILGGIPKL